MINLRHKRIIVTFLMHLGDLVLITPFLQVLRRHAQGSDITLVVDEKVADVVRYNPNVDHVVTVDKKGKDNSIGALWHIGRKLHQNHYDVLINLHPNERTSFLATVIQAREFLGMSHFLFRPFMDRYTRLDRIHLHAADMYMNVLEQLGIDDYRNDGLQLFTCPAWDKRAHDFYADQGVTKDRRLIGFNIGSAVPQKRWPPQRFAAVADYFAGQGYGCVFFGGSMDKAMVQEAASFMESRPIVATGKFSIGELAAAIRRCSLFITNDSGPMHIAVSQGVPVVALYGPSNPKLYGPYTDKAIVLESTDHYELGKSMKKIIKEGHYKGISVIPMQQVIDAGEELLRRYGTSGQILPFPGK
ncbi:glycosyltransferase family 9 protein [uncultured Megasphaera sp.]|uniref:glycosyltransferase family 9 protein n=1 Tax=uncultured Megasphaera sp. TaxID=165188 RepID=UPI00265A12A4|nr:glycosyltransferase family 9 protein [uncultured Megasphaera sp.]